MTTILVIDIGGTHIKFLAVEDSVHRELGRHYPTTALRNSDPIGSLARMISEVRDVMAVMPEAIVATVPGFLNPDLDLVHYAGNVPELNGRRFASELGARLGLDVYLERDSVLLLKGEWAAGAGRGARHLLGIFFGTGVGGAFLQEGVPFRGSGFSMEIGSMPFKGLGRTLEGLRPDCLESVTALASEVLHFRIGVDSSAPWTGTSPLRRAKLTAELLNTLETALSETYANAPLGSSVVPFPESTGTDLETLARGFKGRRGRVLLRESVNVAAQGGVAPNGDWRPQGLTPNLKHFC